MKKSKDEEYIGQIESLLLKCEKSNYENVKRIHELEKERDFWKSKADMYRKQLGGITAAFNRTK